MIPRDQLEVANLVAWKSFVDQFTVDEWANIFSNRGLLAGYIAAPDEEQKLRRAPLHSKEILDYVLTVTDVRIVFKAPKFKPNIVASSESKFEFKEGLSAEIVALVEQGSNQKELDAKM